MRKLWLTPKSAVFGVRVNYLKMYTKEEINLIILSSIEELSYKNRFTLLDELSSSEPDFAKYENILIKSLSEGVYNKVKGKFFSTQFREKILGRLNDLDIKCVTYFSEGYPEQLKHIPCPPIVLFCKGNTELLKDRLFAVVGSRRTQPVPLKECTEVAKELTRHFTLVTGTADGADTAVLDGALSSGKIISVFACGFNHYYPSVNEKLLKKVERKGLLISEYTPQIAPARYNFPVRNRIIAALSEGTLIVSAGKKSGAGITARYALDYGKRVFAFPYSIGVTSGEGCNALIRDGATLATGYKDILEDFGISEDNKKEVFLTEDESIALKFIKDAGEAFAPDIAAKLGQPPFRIIPLLTALEIKGLIVRLGGNRYAAI